MRERYFTAAITATRCNTSLRTGVISLQSFRKGAKVHNAGNLSNDFSKKVPRGKTLKPSA